MQVCCIAAFSCYCFTTDATQRLAQVKWFTTVILFKSSAPTLQLQIITAGEVIELILMNHAMN